MLLVAVVTIVSVLLNTITLVAIAGGTSGQYGPMTGVRGDPLLEGVCFVGGPTLNVT